MFKRFLSLLLCLLLPLSMAACAQPAEQAAAPSPSAAPAVTQTPQPAAYTAGTYTGSGRGSNGDITVSVTCSDSQITGIEILEQDETYFIFMYPEEVIPARILEKQSLAVDTVAGATLSSNGILSAVADALTQAGGDLDALRAVPEAVKGETRTLECEVLVVGAGFAGLSAANRLQQNGVDVLLIEQLDYTGGSGRFATGAFMLADSDGSLALMKNYMSGRYYFDDFPVAEGTPNVERIMKNLEATRDVYGMFETLGVGMTLVSPDINAYILNLPDSLAPYAATETNINGYGSWGSESLREAYVNQGGKLMLHTRATTLLQDASGAIIGAAAEGADCDYVINAQSVILATGSYSHNQELLQENLPWRVGDYSATSIGADGSGIEMALAVGGVMTEDNYVNGGARVADPMTALSTVDGYWKSSDCISSIAMIVGRRGERLASEQDDRYFRYYPNENGLDQFFAVYDSAQLQSVDKLAELGALASENGPYYKAETLEELAAKCGFDTQTFLNSVSTFNYCCETGEDVFDPSLIDADSYSQDDADHGAGGATEKLPLAEGPFYATRLTFVGFDIIGGIQTGDSGEVLTAGGEAIPGLYAVGFTSSRAFQGSGTAHGYCLMICVSTGLVTADAVTASLQ